MLQVFFDAVDAAVYGDIKRFGIYGKIFIFSPPGCLKRTRRAVLLLFLSLLFIYLPF